MYQYLRNVPRRHPPEDLLKLNMQKSSGGDTHPLLLDGRDPGSSITLANVENIKTERGTLKPMLNGSHAVAL